MDIETIRKMTIREIVSNPDKYGVEVEEDENYILSDEMTAMIVKQFKTDTIYDEIYGERETVISHIEYKKPFFAIIRGKDGYYVSFDADYDCGYGYVDYDDGDHRNVAPSSEYIPSGRVKDGFVDVEIDDITLDETMDGIIDVLIDEVIEQILDDC